MGIIGINKKIRETVSAGFQRTGFGCTFPAGKLIKFGKKTWHFPEAAFLRNLYCQRFPVSEPELQSCVSFIYCELQKAVATYKCKRISLSDKTIGLNKRNFPAVYFHLRAEITELQDRRLQKFLS